LTPNAWNHVVVTYDANEVVIYRNNHASPRAFVVHQVEVAKDMDDALARLARPDFDPAKTAVLEEAFPRGQELGAKSQEPAAKSQEPGTKSQEPGAKSQGPVPSSAAQVVERRTSRMKIKTTLDKPGVLVVSETYFPGWKAYVDGKLAPIVPVDVALRGVSLNAGAHEVLFVYSPWTFNLGAAISLCTLAGLAAWIVRRLRKKRRAGSTGRLPNAQES
jgi:hypothetical protein